MTLIKMRGFGLTESRVSFTINIARPARGQNVCREVMAVKHRHKDRQVCPEAREVASATECTGLMPALPEDDASDEVSAALYNVPAAREE